MFEFVEVVLRAAFRQLVVQLFVVVLDPAIDPLPRM